MKLELKHIAPYLPYGLKCIITYYPEKGLMDLERLSKYKVWLSNGGSVHLWQEQYIDKIKPILRPLSDLTKEINYGLSTYSFINLFEIGDCDGCIFEFEHGNIKTIKALESIAKHNLYHDINYLPNAVVNMMHEYHFDVLGLIEKGLAIDINTLENV